MKRADPEKKKDVKIGHVKHLNRTKLEITKKTFDIFFF